MAAQRTSGIAQEKLQDIVLSRGQIDALAGSGNLTRGGVQTQICEFEDHGASNGATPRDGSEPRQQNFESEWLCQIIIGAYIQPLNNIGHAVFGRKNENWRTVARFTQTTSKSEPVLNRQHKIQNDDVEVSCLGRFQANPSVGCEMNLMPFLGKSPA